MAGSAEHQKVLLTDEQQKALDFTVHRAVTANAGSGKTTVLVQRFVDILLRTDTRVNEIVAITFTEKAAGELRKRVAGALAAAMSESRDPKMLRRLEQARDQLASAVIGTIHSFCAQLLRLNPVEVPPSGIDAAFTVIEEVDKNLLVRQSIDETLDSLLRGRTSDVPLDDIKYAIATFGRRTFVSYLDALFRSREEVDRVLASRKLDAKSALADWKRSVEDSMAALLNDSQWVDSLAKVAAAAEGKSADPVREMLARARKSKNLEEKIRFFAEAGNLMFTKRAEVRSDFAGRKTDRTKMADDSRAARRLYGTFKDLLDSLAAGSVDEGNRTLLRLTRTLLDVYRNAGTIYEEKKALQGKLDFDDLQLKALQLLQREDVGARLAASYKYIMVDEFQDTNRLQDDIVRLLIGNFRSGNLFIVGDPKQSIYGFRHSEVAVFEKTAGDIGKTSQGGSDSHIIMDGSFRLLPSLVDFVNRVFGNAMTEGTSGFDVGYHELVNGREGPGKGRVELLILPKREEESEDDEADEKPDLVANESELVARRVAALVRAQSAKDSEEQNERRFDYRDVAILLRARTHVRKLEHALHAAGVPYAVAGGIGFYQTQELYDFLNYFKFLLNPADDIALAGILRSPFFGISDARLYEISLVNRGESFWKKTQACSTTSRSDEFLKYAVEILRDNLRLSNRIPIPQLVHRVLRQTGWEGVAAGLPFGAQKLANLEKLLRFAREFETRGLTNMYDFVERLKILVEEQEREGQANPESRGNAVTVMTIHAAKGLEFPAVFIPFSHSRFQPDKGIFIDPDLGIGFKVKSDTDPGEEIEPAFYQFLKMRAKLKKEAEEKRVFYVACTRAKDMLVVSGCADDRPPFPSYLGWVCDGLGISPAVLRPGALDLGAREFRTLRMKNGKYAAGKSMNPLTINIVTSKEEIAAPRTEADDPSQKPAIGKLLIEPLSGQSRGEFYSATQLRTFFECPTKYYLRYRVGLPEENAVAYDFDENEEANDRILGELEGSLTHAVLQHLGVDDTTDEAIRSRVKRLVASSPRLDERQAESLSTSILKNVTNFRSSAIGASILKSDEVRTEFTITSAFGDDFLTGTIDRMYRNDKNEWSIVDYKTDAVTKSSLKERAELYMPQLMFYALLVNKLFSQRSVECSLVFLRQADAPIRRTLTEHDLDVFEERVRGAIQKIKSEKFDRNVEICPTCPYRQGGRCILPSK